MGGWQIAMIVILAASLLAAANMHGKPRSAYSFWAALVGSGIQFMILYFGGFFR